MKSFLKATAALHTTVNAKSIVIALVDRLSNYALTEKTKLEGKDGDLFTVFTEQLRKVFETYPHWSIIRTDHDWLVYLIGQRIDIFENHKSQIIEGRESLELEDVLSMEASLMHLGLIQKQFWRPILLSPKCHRNLNFVSNVIQKRFF